MDIISQKVYQMYSKYPFPSPHVGGKRLAELADLLNMFCIEMEFDLSGRSVLDAGTGTGHRLIEAAAAHPDCRFLAIDFSEVSLGIARANALKRDIRNVEFLQCDIVESTSSLGVFDVVLVMGVLHHLSDPSRGLAHLVGNLSDNGILLLYVYGKIGAAERMRRKQMISMLVGERMDFDLGIDFVKELGFDSFEYGWNIGADDQLTLDSLIVDAYLHVNEHLYTFDDILDLLRSSGLVGFAIYGITSGTKGVLLDMDLCCPSMPKSEAIRRRYKALSVADKYRFADLFYKPNGYTIVAFKGGGLNQFDPSTRIQRNLVML
jgi:SAM-dependent methyltransferase